MPEFQPMKVRTHGANGEILSIWREQGAAYNVRDADHSNAALWSSPPFMYLYSDGRVTFGSVEEHFAEHRNPEYRLVNGTLVPVENATPAPSRGMKVRVPTPACSEAVQRLWLERGAVWSRDEQSVQYTSRPYLYLSPGGQITRGDSAENFLDDSRPEYELRNGGLFPALPPPPTPVRPPNPSRHPLDTAALTFSEGDFTTETATHLATAHINVLLGGTEIHTGGIECHGSDEVATHSSDEVAKYLRSRVLDALNGVTQLPSLETPPKGPRARARHDKQVALLREARAALDSLLSDRPDLISKLHGPTTLGNLRDSLFEYK